MSTLPMGNGIAQLLQALTGREGYDMRQAERSVNEQQDRRDAIAGLPPRYEYGDVRTARDDVDYARENSQVNWRTAGQGGLVGLIGSLVNARNARKMGEQARGDLSKAMKEQERQRMEYYKNMPPESVSNVAAPSNVREYEFFSKLDPEAQSAYLNMKRAGTVVDVGGVPTRVTPSGESLPLSDLSRESDAARRIAESTESGRQDAERAGAIGASQDNRLMTEVQSAYNAMDQAPRIGRTLELLQLVETGGFDAAQRRVSQFLGTESADQVELNNILKTQVLSQLREVFGAQFTQKEGELLQQVEANFGKSTEGNIRLLEQAKKQIVRKLTQGLMAAEDVGDARAAKRFQETLDSLRLQSMSNEDLEKMLEPGAGQ